MSNIAPTPLLVILSGPSGSGKTTLCNGFIKHHPDFVRAVTCTTRPPRPGEKDGIDYYFVDADDFIARVHKDEFLEHATVYEKNYGTLKTEVDSKLSRGKNVLLAVDVQGASAIREQAKSNETLRCALVTVFIIPPSMKELERRLKKRNLDSNASIEKRLREVTYEIGQWKNFDYLLISGTPNADVERLGDIVGVEKLKTIRCAFPLKT